MKMRKIKSRSRTFQAHIPLLLVLLISAVSGVGISHAAIATTGAIEVEHPENLLTDCTVRGIVDREMAAAAPSSNTSKFDPGIVWLESLESQSEVDTFWTRVKEQNLAEVGAWIDFQNEKIQVVVNPHSLELEEVGAIASETFSNLKYSVSERCMSLSDLEEMMKRTQEHLSEILKSGVPFSVEISEETSTVNVSLEKGALKDFQSALSDVADARIILEVSPLAVAAYSRHLSPTS